MIDIKDHLEVGLLLILGALALGGLSIGVGRPEWIPVLVALLIMLAVVFDGAFLEWQAEAHSATKIVAPDPVGETIGRLTAKVFTFGDDGIEMNAAEILRRVGREMVSGFSMNIWSGGDSKFSKLLELESTYEMREVLNEFWLEGLLRQEERHGWSSNPASPSNAPYYVLYLTPHGTEVVRRLEATSP